MFIFDTDGYVNLIFYGFYGVLWGSDPANGLLFQDILFIFGVFGVLECTFGGQKQQFKIHLGQNFHGV